MVNKVVLMGRLTRDPELRHTQSNTAVCSFTLAVDRGNRRSNSDPNQQTTDFIDIVAWTGTAEFVSKWFRKGQLVAVCGRLQTRKWTDNEGKNRVSTEVIAEEVHFAEPKRDSYGSEGGNYGGYGSAPQESPYQSGGYNNASRQSAPSGGGFTEISEDEDELPF